MEAMSSQRAQADAVWDPDLKQPILVASLNDVTAGQQMPHLPKLPAGH